MHMGPRMEMRVVTLGLDGAGKTSILFKLKQDEFVAATPTIGFNVESLELRSDLQLTVWDVGGQPKLRPLWKHYYLNTQVLIVNTKTVKLCLYHNLRNLHNQRRNSSETCKVNQN